MRKNGNTIMGLFLMAMLCLIISAGCASGPIGKLPTLADDKPTGEVTIIRISSMIGATNSYRITLDGNDIFAIRSGQNTKFKLNEGEYHIGVKCFGGWSPTWKEDSLMFHVAPGSNSYFQIKPSGSCAKIEEITEEEAQEKIQNSKFVSFD